MSSKKKKSADAATLERRREKDRERKRRHRANQTEEQLQHKRQKDMERYYRLKQENKIKTIKDKTPREVRKLRKYWRITSKKYRAKKKAALNDLQDVVTSPPSPDSNLRVEEIRESVQKVRGRKNVRRDKAKVYRTVNKQKRKILELERKVEKYKKRLRREKKKRENPASPSPRKQVQKLVGREKVSPMIKKQLFLGYALKKQVETNAKEAEKKTKKQQLFCKYVGNKVLKKYRVQKHFTKVIPYKMNKSLSCDTDKTQKYTRQRRQCVTNKNDKTIVSFFEDDTVSKMCPGKKDFVRKGKLKKQRRILLDSLQNLHRRFTEKTSIKMSFATFARSRPFWVTSPRKSDRETCACVRHCNMEHMVFALKSNKVITETNVEKVVSAVVCSVKNEDCMLGRCTVCANKRLKFSYDSDYKIKFWKWKNIKEERLINKKKKVISKTVKVKETVTVKKMISIFNEELKLFKKHVLYHSHQAKQLKTKTRELKENELLIRVDFSENYVCKYAEEVQSVHFGASKRQICLNTGIWYAVEEGSVVSHCFATVSDNLDHQAHAIWAHMCPILERTACLYPNTETIHFFSDSPSSQYRNRINMHFMKLQVPKLMKSVKRMTWNFTAAGHGKGPMDGVGGALKRMADQHVSHGTDITSAADFINVLQGTTIMMTEVKGEDVKKMKSEVDAKNIPAIKGIMSVHQVIYNQGLMYINSLSCFACDPNKTCKHYFVNKIFENDSQPSQPIQKSPLDLLAEDLPSDFECDGEEVSFANRSTASATKAYLNDVFSSSEDEDLPSAHEEKTEPSTAGPPSTSTGKNVYDPVDNIKLGSFLLVRFTAETTKSKKNNHRQFVGVSQSEIDDGEIVVMFLKQLSGDNTCFYPNEKDTSTIDTKQIVAVLPNPALMMKGDRVFYKFPRSINVF